MLAVLFRRIVPLLVVGGLSLTMTSCVVHERDYGRRGYDHHDHHRDYGYRHDRY